MFTSPEISRSCQFSTFRLHLCQSGRGGLSHLWLTTLRLIAVAYLLSSPIWAPHWVPKSVTNISLLLLVLLNTLQSATGARGLWSQGVTAVVHSYSIHALGPILGETTLLRERYKQAAFSVIFIEKQQPAGEVVSQPHCGKQYKGPKTQYLTHWTWFTQSQEYRKNFKVWNRTLKYKDTYHNNCEYTP